MARIFGALANAAAKYGEGRLKRQAYDDSQAQQDLENQRRAFEFSAMQGFQRDQLEEQKRQREAVLKRQQEGDVVNAQQAGYEDAAPESIASAANAFLQTQGMGMPAKPVRAPQTEAASFEADGVPFSAGQQGAPRYATVGGRVMRYDPQRPANDAARKAFEKFAQDLKIKRDVAQENQAQRDEAAKDRAIQVEAIRAASRPQPQPKMAWITDGKTFLRVGPNDAIPAGFRPAANSMTPPGLKTGAGEGKALRSALEDVTARVYAMGESGGVPDIGVPAAYAITKLTDPNAGTLSTVAARQFMAQLSPEEQQFGNLLSQLNAVVMPARGGKAITQNEVKIIMGAAQPVAGESPEMRQQRMRAIFNVVGPLLASEDGDLEGAVNRVIERSRQYAPQASAAPTSGRTPEQEARFNRFRKP